jgi:hypothetical protein
MTVLDEISILVRDANPGRQFANIQRRTIKLNEELGEVAQAWLNVTSPSNGKGKTWDDVREEIADCLIVALDIGWTTLRGETEQTPPVVTARESLFNDLMISEMSLHLGLFGLRSSIAMSDMYMCQARHDITGVINVAATMALAVLPDQVGATPRGEVEARLLIEVKRKLAKWADNRVTMAVVTDDV